MRNDEVVKAAWLSDGAGTHAERAANYVRDRAKLLRSLDPDSPEWHRFMAAFPASYDAASPREPAPLIVHSGASDAVH